MSRILLRSVQTTLRSTPVPSSRFINPRFFHTTILRMADAQKDSPVHELKSVAAWKEALATHDVVFVDWFATWCGPCKAMTPLVHKWAEDETNKPVHFVKIDVDEVPELSQEYGIRAMPTFMIFKNGEKVDEFVGAKPPLIEQLLVKHRPEVKAE